MATRKKTNPSTKKTPTTKNAKAYKHFDDYLCTRDFAMKPMSEGGISRLAQKAREWAMDKKSLVMNDFYDEYGIDPKTWYRWRMKSDILEATHKFMLRRLASNREIGALNKKLSENMVMKRQHQFDPEWKEAEKYHNDMKKDVAEQGAATIQVLKMQSPSSSLVPERGDDDQE